MSDTKGHHTEPPKHEPPPKREPRYSSPEPKPRPDDYADRCKALCEKLEAMAVNVGTTLGADDLAVLNAAVTELKAMAGE